MILSSNGSAYCVLPSRVGRSMLTFQAPGVADGRGESLGCWPFGSTDALAPISCAGFLSDMRGMEI